MLSKKLQQSQRLEKFPYPSHAVNKLLGQNFAASLLCSRLLCLRASASYSTCE
jgi:hypothetical protein